MIKTPHTSPDITESQNEEGALACFQGVRENMARLNEALTSERQQRVSEGKRRVSSRPPHPIPHQCRLEVARLLAPYLSEKENDDS